MTVRVDGEFRCSNQASRFLDITFSIDGDRHAFHIWPMAAALLPADRAHFVSVHMLRAMLIRFDDVSAVPAWSRKRIALHFAGPYQPCRSLSAYPPQSRRDREARRGGPPLRSSICCRLHHRQQAQQHADNRTPASDQLAGAGAGPAAGGFSARVFSRARPFS